MMKPACAFSVTISREMLAASILTFELQPSRLSQSAGLNDGFAKIPFKLMMDQEPCIDAASGGVQRDDLYFPSWAYALPTTILRIPYSFVEAFVCTGIVSLLLPGDIQCLAAGYCSC